MRHTNSDLAKEQMRRLLSQKINLMKEKKVNLNLQLPLMLIIQAKYMSKNHMFGLSNNFLSHAKLNLPTSLKQKVNSYLLFQHPKMNGQLLTIAMHYVGIRQQCAMILHLGQNCLKHSQK